VGLKPREQTCLGSSIAAAGGRLEGRKLQASQRAKQKHTGAGSDCLRLPAPSPSPHARARDKEATRYIEGKDCAWLRRRPSSGSAIAARGEKKEQGSRWNWESDGFLREGAVIWPQKEESFLRSPPSSPRSYTALRSRGRQSDWSFGNGEGK